ncbi:hypothetical protein Agabi119p4_7009 [Agaricus bisporus var. burnettii]|uniref:Uncharacterized protein n=1 Tax=Agaricus bisporus var. burnettii TaxID=192524 RepID=A0A8H7KFV4_AGABI|nr:hypothetical protein Agabi119p4_7009 [Agaricus bisporus var. burnettii]
MATELTVQGELDHEESTFPGERHALSSTLSTPSTLLTRRTLANVSSIRKEESDLAQCVGYAQQTNSRILHLSSRMFLLLPALGCGNPDIVFKTPRAYWVVQP